MNIQRIIGYYHQIPKPAKVSFWFTICNFLQKGISLISIPIVTRLLSTQEYGVYSVFQTWSDILIVLTSLHLFGNSFNVGMKKHLTQKAQYTSSICTLCILVTFMWFAVYIVFREAINAFSGLATFYWIVMFLGVLTKPGFEFWSVGNRYDFKYKALVIVTLCISFCVPLSKIISIQIAHHAGWNQSKAAVVGHMLPVFIVGLFLTILLIKRGKSGYIRKYWVFGLKFNIPLIPYYLSLKILDQSDRIMIDKYVGSDAAGIYSLAYSAASMLVILNSAINAGYIPWQFKAMTAKRNKDVVKTTNAILIVIGVANLLLMSAAPELLSILAPKSYYEALYVIPPIAISCFFRYLGQIFINIEFYYEKSRYTSLASVCSAVLNVGLNALFIPHFGYLAAGYTTLLCYIVNMGFHYYMAMRLTKKNGEIFYFRLETILLQSVAAVGFSLIFILTYENVLIRYSILIALVVVIIWNRKRLGEILRHFSIGKQ